MSLNTSPRFLLTRLAGLGLCLLLYWAVFGSGSNVSPLPGDAALAQKFAARMLEKGVYVIGFFFPVVAQGKARIRTQVSAVHSREDLAFAIEKFAEVKQEFGL